MSNFSEKERLENLESYNLNNGYPKEQLVSIIKLASEICNASVSLIDIIDENNQRTIARHGDWEEKTISRDHSICDRVVVNDKMLILNEVADHPEIWKRLPEKDREKIKFYAGAPLKSPEGFSLGALCVIDSEPKKLTEFQIESLQTLADEVMARLHQHKQTKLLRQQNSRLEKYSVFLKNSADLLCIIDPGTHQIVDISKDCEEELGISQKELIGRDFSDYVESDLGTTSDILNWFKEAEKHGDRHSLPIRLVNNFNTVKWYRCSFTSENNNWYLTARNITNQKIAEDRLKALRDKFEKITKASTDLIFEYDAKTRMITWRSGLKNILGYSREDKYVDFEWWAEKIHPEDKNDVLNSFYNIVESDEIYWKATYRFRASDGSYIYLLGNAYIDRDESGSPTIVIGALADISDLRKSELQQKRLLSRLNHANHMAELGFWEIDLKDGAVFWSDEMYNILNADKEKTTPSVDFILDRVDTEDKEKITAILSNLSLDKGVGEIEHKIQITEKKSKYLYHRAELEYGKGEPEKVLITTQEITDRKKKELKIVEALKEKETLLSEIHHRVKNNLAIVSGLLEMNSIFTENESIDNFIRSSQLRIKSMAKIHEILYQSESFTHVSFKEYILDLLDTIKLTFSEKDFKIDIDTKIDDVNLNINYAIPCGLILNELISNSFKHAFEEVDSGFISVEFVKKEKLIYLVVQDNGVGLPPDFNISKFDTLGMTLVNILTKQIGATLVFDSTHDGFKCIIKFEQKEEVKGSASSFM